MGQSEKYDFPIGDNPGGNVGLIMSHIKNGSHVLECGCASGYMTKYMAEKLHCHMSIVEIDKECIEKAKQYAIDWYTGDLEENGWFNYYNQVGGFDYILFADVLEHLKNPVEVLKKAEKLLAYYGKIIISIPNVCHNDILIRMFYDNWQYTGLGLLDETHIHFWGVNQLPKFANEAGLKIVSIEAVCIPTQQTEQRMNKEIYDGLLNVLKKRLYGEVYQWVIVCEKIV